MPEILIADDHPLFRDALSRAAAQALPAVQLFQADSVPALFALVESHANADLLLLDLQMPGARGFSALAHLRGHHPQLPIIIVSAHEESDVARRAIAHGASGYVPKSMAGENIVEAIHAVLDGEVWLPAQLSGGSAELRGNEAMLAARIGELTPHQFRVLGMVADGLLNKQIAYELGVSEATIKAHMTAIMRKLGCSNRTQVALAASQLTLDPGNVIAVDE
ncbi:MAG: response regulator transcription factor [Xanthomonadales bacterium]|nr:response regulator transcription factor [Xanthomonadales bacterium]